MYELERWQLTPERTGYLSSYKTLLGLAIERFAVGSLTLTPTRSRTRTLTLTPTLTLTLALTLTR